MTYRFGDFELDTNARTLYLGNVAQTIQPLVFDLLVYLVSNAGRLIPKDELLDALWPGVIVTESSLQRAVSLARRAIALGGLAGAIQNHARRGYRFTLEAPGSGELSTALGSNSNLRLARAAVAQRDWKLASAEFGRAASVVPLEPDDLELWALADECRGSPTSAIAALMQAVESHASGGRPNRAARAALSLARIELERWAIAAAQGWVARAEALLVSCVDDAAWASLFWTRSRLAAVLGLPRDALMLAQKASDLAESSGDSGLRALTLVNRGFCHISLGTYDEGSRLQNQAAALALSSRVDPITVSQVYCNILWACRTSADWERALQWSDGFETWCSASFAEIPGACDLHRAEILGVRGSLAEAYARISDALLKLTGQESWSVAEGHRVRGDLSAMAGEMDQAEADYATAYSLGWDAEPGNAVLLFERGDVEGAFGALDRALAGRTWFHLQRRPLLLANAARIAALAGYRERANGYLDELRGDEGHWTPPAIRATAAEAQAALFPAGDRRAIQSLVDARLLWSGAKIDFHAARLHLEIARVLIGGSDTTGAWTELKAAEHGAQRIGSARLLEACAKFRSEFGLKAAATRKDKLQISVR